MLKVNTELRREKAIKEFIYFWLFDYQLARPDSKKKEIIDTLKSIIEDAKKQGHIIVRIEDLENAIPELKKESEDEKIRKEISNFLLTTSDLRLVGNIKRFDFLC